jgi:rubredoxin
MHSFYISLCGNFAANPKFKTLSSLRQNGFWYSWHFESLKWAVVKQILRPEVIRVKKWQCLVCSFIYDEELGLPEEGIAPGTRWDDIPDDWMCPDCGVGKEDFEMAEI